MLLFLYIYSCNSNDAHKECKSPLGSILFNKTRIEWGYVLLGKDYSSVIKIYNPSNKDIKFKILVEHSELLVHKVGDKSFDFEENGITLNSGSCDSLVVQFSPRDISMIGTYSKGIHFKIDDELLISPLEMSATILESFDSLKNESSLSVPVFTIDKDTVDFGTISSNNKCNTSFLVMNTGKKDLIIRKVESTCGCATITPAKRIIKPQDSTVLDVVFNPSGKTGKQYKSIRIFSNAPNAPVTTLVLTGFVSE